MMKTKTLTEGTPWKQILLFSIPIFWGNVFQLLYTGRYKNCRKVRWERKHWQQWVPCPRYIR